MKMKKKTPDRYTFAYLDNMNFAYPRWYRLCVCYGWLQVLEYLQVTAMIHHDNIINVCFNVHRGIY